MVGSTSVHFNLYVGVVGMRERLRQLGGIVEIQSNGTGTVVSATFEVSKDQGTVSHSETSLASQPHL
jgi:signal transduction histidine kinase